MRNEGGGKNETFTLVEFWFTFGDRRFTWERPEGDIGLAWVYMGLRDG